MVSWQPPNGSPSSDICQLKEHVAYIFPNYDGDKDGLIDFGEFCRVSHLSQRESWYFSYEQHPSKFLYDLGRRDLNKQQMELCFQLVNLKHNGFVSVDEMGL